MKGYRYIYARNSASPLCKTKRIPQPMCLNMLLEASRDFLTTQPQPLPLTQTETDPLS